jgi:hypothetical protein
MNERAVRAELSLSPMTMTDVRENFFVGDENFGKKMLHKNYKFVQLLASDTGLKVFASVIDHNGVELDRMSEHEKPESYLGR